MLNRKLFHAGVQSASTRRASAGTNVTTALLTGLMEEVEAQSVNINSQYAQFKRTYRKDPEAFVHDCVRHADNEGPTFYQDEILNALIRYLRVCIRSPHGAGKSTTAAWIILWFSLVHDGEDWKNPTTASAWRQLEKFLWPEVHKWFRKLRWDKIGRDPWVEHRELLDLGIKLTTGEAFATASDEPARMEGAHADKLLYLIDEGKAVPPSIWDAIEGAFAGGGTAMAGAWSTPGEPTGRFYDIQSKKPGYEDWHVIRITLDDCVRAGRIKQAWADQRKRMWGEKSALYLNRVLGEFASADTDGVIPLAWIEMSNDRWRKWRDTGAVLPTFTGLGVDVAAGGDNSTIAPRYDWLIPEIFSKSTPDTMELVGRVYGLLQKLGGYAVVDLMGMGTGPTHRLQEMLRREVDEYGTPVLPAAVYAFVASGKSLMKDRSKDLGFVNMRAEGWWSLREQLDPMFDPTLALPPDDELTGDLTAPHYRVMSGGRIQIEEKDEIRKRIGRSTDKGDSVMEICTNLNSIRGPAAGIADYYVSKFLASKKAVEEQKVEN